MANEPIDTPSSANEPIGHSLLGRVAIAFVITVAASTAASLGLTHLPLPSWIIFLLALVITLPLGLWLLHRLLERPVALLHTLGDALDSLRDRDFSLRVTATDNDEIGRLARAYNRAVDELRDERETLRQRELLLETAVERSPLAIILIGNRGRIIVANAEARRLLYGGGRLAGQRFADVLEGCPPAMRALAVDGADGLFTVETVKGSETYHLAQRGFQLNRQSHTLLLLRRLTAELDREEVRIWKEVIRVISHELNNSLAPISSLVHSASVAADHPEHRHRLGSILSTVEERIAHLSTFLDGYARFARLPKPRPADTPWAPLLERLRELYPFTLDMTDPELISRFDPAQVQQVLINLLKNAHEADPSGEVTLRIGRNGTDDDAVVIEVLDRGPGIDDSVLRRVFVPFYSTKEGGSGVGLPLSREIIAQHGGSLRLSHRDGGGTVVTARLPG
ncbi:MAG: ATP-binding protein [Acidobacteriota bacterium]